MESEKCKREKKRKEMKYETTTYICMYKLGQINTQLYEYILYISNVSGKLKLIDA